MPTRLKGMLLGFVASMLVVLLWPVQGLADATVVSSVPRPGANLGSVPAAVILQFSENLNRSFSHADVLTPDGRRFGSEPARDQAIVIPIAGQQRGVG